MATFEWVGGSVFSDQGRYAIASDWYDATTGYIGDATPQAGDTGYVFGVANSGIYRLGALFEFPFGGGYPVIYFFGPQDPLTLETDPGAILGYTLQGQTLNVDGTQGAVSLWLENSQLQDMAINVTGTAVISSYLDNTVSGAITVGSDTATGFLQTELIPYDTDLIGPDDHYPVTTFDATVTVSGGSTFSFEAGANDATGVINNGAINVLSGGTFILDDQDNPNAATSQGGVFFQASHNLLLGNGGSINLYGAAGQTTTAVLLADTTGPGSITVNGGGASPSATTLTMDGSMTGQNVTLIDGTVVVNDAGDAITVPGDPGFDVSGGSFTFGDANGELVLHQAPLTTLTFTADYTQELQASDGRNPFSTPISGFGAGDVIALPGKYLGGFGLFTYATAYDPATGVLQVQSPSNIVGNPPAILASLTLQGGYDPSLFQLTGNSDTEELDVTYNGEPTTTGPAFPASSAGDVGPSDPASVFELPAPVDGVGTTDVSSLDPAPLLGQGDSMQFLPDSQAVTLVNDALSTGSGTATAWPPDPTGELVTQLYEAGLNRAPNLAELQDAVQALQDGLTPAQLAQDLVGSPEFAALFAGRDSAQLLASFYQDGLGRAPDAAELQAGVSALQSGANLGTLLLGVASSSEAYAHLSPSM